MMPFLWNVNKEIYTDFHITDYSSLMKTAYSDIFEMAETVLVCNCQIGSVDTEKYR